MATASLGLIPAHAGKTFQRRSFRVQSAAHPRSRGENTMMWDGRFLSSGSSPLTRGKLDEVHVLVPGEGLIPAHAGKTTDPTLNPHTQRAHPRSRGENPKRR